MKKSEVKPGVLPAPPGEGEFSLIPRNKLLDLYAGLLKCHRIAAATQDRRKRSRPVSEAVTVGVTIDLLASDAISPEASDLTPCAVKCAAVEFTALEGAALKTLLRWWSNPSRRVPRIVAHAKVIPPAASIAARLEAALRLAADFRATNCGSVVVFFIGPDIPQSKPAASPEQLRPLLLRAAVERLPMLFVSQNDGDAGDFLSISKQCGIPDMVVDRDDVVAVYRVAFEALSHARRGSGPTLIDCQPWRLKSRGRKTRRLSASIDKMELYLSGKGLAYKPVKNKIGDKFGRQFAAELGRIKSAFARAGKT